jgi:hypothetical protein
MDESGERRPDHTLNDLDDLYAFQSRADVAPTVLAAGPVLPAPSTNAVQVRDFSGDLHPLHAATPVASPARPLLLLDAHQPIHVTAPTPTFRSAGHAGYRVRTGRAEAAATSQGRIKDSVRVPTAPSLEVRFVISVGRLNVSSHPVRPEHMRFGRDNHD